MQDHRPPIAATDGIPHAVQQRPCCRRKPHVSHILARRSTLGLGANASAAAVVRIVSWARTGLGRQQAVGDLPIFRWRLPGCGESASTKRRLLVDLRLSGSVAAAREQVAACPSNVGALDGSWTLLLHDGAELGCQCCSSSRAEAELRRRPLWIALGKREWGEHGRGCRTRSVQHVSGSPTSRSTESVSGRDHAESRWPLRAARLREARLLSWRLTRRRSSREDVAKRAEGSGLWIVCCSWRQSGSRS
jgi:hypothetical protein